MNLIDKLFLRFAMKARRRFNMDLDEGFITAIPESHKFYQMMGVWCFNEVPWYLRKMAVDTLPVGTYFVKYSDTLGIYYQQVDNITDDLVELHDGKASVVRKEIEKFWGLKETCARHGFLHRRGILLYGPPGCGKSSAIAEVSKDVVNAKGYVLYLQSAATGYHGIRQIQSRAPTAPILSVIEDIDAKMAEGQQQWVIAEWLSLLDGELKLDGVLYLATTNYPDKLEERITKRPGRFDALIKLDMPDRPARLAYLTHKLPDNPILAELIADQSEGFSVAYLREVIMLHCVFGYSIEDTLARVHKHLTEKTFEVEDDIGKESFGFGKE